MKKLFPLFIMMMSLTSIAVTSAMTADESSAQTVMNNYFLALSQGDTSTLKSLMTGDFLEKRSRLLDNPTYPAYLRETFGNARFTIDNINTSDSDVIVIDASIIIDQDDISKRRFYLRMENQSESTAPAYYIYNETQAE